MDGEAEAPTKRRRVGQRQRLAAAKAELEEPPVSESFLAKDLQERWSWGELSPQAVQALAAKAVQDFEACGAKAPTDLKALAKLGSSGVHPNHMRAQIVKITEAACRMPPLHRTALQFKQPWGNQPQLMMLPHQMFSALYENYHEAFQRFVVPNEDVLEEFWRRQRKHPQYKDHPVVSKASFQPRQFVPLSLHGDGTPAIGVGKIWSRMLTTWSWCSLVCGPAWTKDSQLPIYFMFDETDDGTAATTFLTMLAWSFKVLQEGLWPFADREGNRNLGLHQHFWVWIKSENSISF